MSRASLVIALLLAVLSVKAQDDPEYRMEIGAGVGLVTYEGDFNGNLFKESQPMATVMLRRILSPWMGLRLNASFGKIKGSSANVETKYPEYLAEPYTFDRSLYDVCLTYEYNFLPYGTGRDYRGAKPLVPFVFIGLGASIASGGDAKTAASVNMPIGLGLKYKVGKRVNLGLEWSMHFSQSDELDGVKDPYGIKSSGLFKNTDCYSVLQLSLTYSFMPKCVTCNKDY
ncbi:MAG: DUF6089 family protein [Prevotella sp.]